MMTTQVSPDEFCSVQNEALVISGRLWWLFEPDSAVIPPYSTGIYVNLRCAQSE